jgi:hypothetical protein
LAALDPVQLLQAIRQAQQELVALEIGDAAESAAMRSEGLGRFVASLSTAWREGEVRPTHRKRCRGPRTWRTRADPFEAVWPLVEQWLVEQPEVTAKELFGRLQAQGPEAFRAGQLRTLQRRVKHWRRVVAQRLVFGDREPQGVMPVLIGGASAMAAAPSALG